MRTRMLLGATEDNGYSPDRPPDVFVGRVVELEALHRSIDAAARGEGSIVLISGEPGIGKTRLAEEAVTYARAANVRALWGRCWEGYGAPAFWPWIQIVRSLARELEAESWTSILAGDAADMARVIPELSEFLPGTPFESAPADADQARFRCFESCGAFLRRLADLGPTMLVLDDLHWADQGSLLLLQYLSAIVAEAALVVVGTCRDFNPLSEQCFSQVVATLGRQRHISRLALSGLREPEARELLSSTIRFEPSKLFIAAMVQRAEGNPFFLRKLTEVFGGRNHVTECSVGEIQLSIPLSIREAIGAHLRSASVDCATILNIASVVGREFDANIVAEAIGLPILSVCKVLDEAVASRIVVNVRATQYRFEHVLVREVIYDALTTTYRARMHAAVTMALERLGATAPSQLSTLAHHAFMAVPYGSAEQAFEYALHAGTYARSRLAYEEAVASYERALEIGGSKISPATHCDILLFLGEAQMSAGRWLEARHTFERAATEARLIRSPSQFARAAIGFKGMMGGTIPVDDAAIALLREAMSWLSDTDAHLKVHVLSALTHALYFARAEDEMERYSYRAVEMAKRWEDALLRRTALDARLISLFRPSQLRERLRTAEELLAVSSGLEDREFAFRARLMLHISSMELGDPLRSAQELEQAARLADETRHPRSQWHVLLARASTAVAGGDLSRAAELTEVAREVGDRVHDSSTIHYFLIQRFQLQRVMGSYDGWEPFITAAVARFPEVIGYRAAEAIAYSMTGAATKARRALSLIAAGQFRDVARDAVSLWTLAMLAEVCATCGGAEWCESLYSVLSPYRNQNVVVSWGVAFDGSVSHFLGLLSTALGQFESAESDFQVALEMNAKMGAEPLVARTQIRYAEMLMRRRQVGDQARALGLLKEAVDMTRRLGQVGHLADAQALLERAGGAWSPSAPDSVVEGDARHFGMAARQELAVVGTDRPEYVFRREGEFWTIAFEGRVVRLRHARGLAMLAVLLQRPEMDVHVIDLISAVDGGRALVMAEHANQRGRGARNIESIMEGNAGPLLDARARMEYRRRADELRYELAEAQRFNDIGRTAKLRHEIGQLTNELKRAYAPGGRTRLAGAGSERARINVRNNISTALTILKRSNPALWRHFQAAIRTGTLCAYRPERPIPWVF